MNEIVDLAKKYNFSKENKIKASIKRHIDDYFNEETSQIEPSLSLLSLKRSYKKGEKCYNASIYEYIFITLINIRKYLDLLESRDHKISKCEIIILTTQIPDSFKEDNEINTCPYYSHDIMSEYMKIFNKMTQNKKFVIKRYYMCDEKNRSKGNGRIKIFHTQNDLQKCFCNDINSSGKCYKCKYKNKDSTCLTERLLFFDINKNAQYYYLPLCALPGNRNINTEIRELIGFKIDGVWDIVITSNLIDSMSNLFLKFHDKSELNNENKFHFLSSEGRSFVDFINSIEENRMLVDIKEMWALNSKGT